MVERVQNMGEQLVAAGGQGEFSLEQCPVVQKSPLIHGVDIHQLSGRRCVGKLSAVQPLLDQLGEPLEIEPLFVGEGFFVLGDQLGGVQVSQQVEIHTVLDHKEQFVVQEEQLVIDAHVRVDGGGQLRIFLIKQVGERVQKRFFSLEIVVKSSFGGLGSIDDILHGGIVVTVFIKKVPRCLYDPALCGLPFPCHVLIPF